MAVSEDVIDPTKRKVSIIEVELKNILKLVCNKVEMEFQTAIFSI